MTTMNPIAPARISLGEELAEAAEELRGCTVVVRGSGAGRGSGVIWRADGLIITNAHVACELESTGAQHTVELSDGRVLKAELLRRDPRHDLAMLRVEAEGLDAAKTRDASSLRVGELVVAVGNPLEARGAFTTGVVSASPGKEDVLMRSDIRLAPGNSGGPLADAQGRVVGINSMVVDGFGVAVTSGAVERFIAGGRERAGGITAGAAARKVSWRMESWEVGRAGSVAEGA